MENMHEILNNICYKIENNFNNNLLLNEEVKNWIEELLDPRYNFLEKIIELVSEPITCEEKKKQLYLIINICIDNFPNILGKVEKNELLIDALSRHITETTNDESLDENAFKLFAKIFNVTTFKECINKELVKVLFDSLNLFDEEEVFEKIIDIILDINYSLKDVKIGKNIVLQVHQEHENSQLFNEALIINLSHEPRNDQMNKIIKFNNQALRKQNKIIFNQVDFETFIDVCTEQLNKSYRDKKKIKFARIFSKITKFDEFYHFFDKIKTITQVLYKVYKKTQNEKLLALCDKAFDNLIEHLEGMYIELGGKINLEEEDDEDNENEEEEEEEDDDEEEDE